MFKMTTDFVTALNMTFNNTKGRGLYKIQVDNDIVINKQLGDV